MACRLTARCRPPPPAGYEEWEERGALAACRCLYKKAGCCLMLGRWQDSMRASKVRAPAGLGGLGKPSAGGCALVAAAGHPCAHPPPPHVQAALGLASWQLDREGGWGKEPFGARLWGTRAVSSWRPAAAYDRLKQLPTPTS